MSIFPFGPVPDTQEAKLGLVAQLAAAAEVLLPPIYILSHNRAWELQTLETIPQLCDLAEVVVAEEEVGEYRMALPYVPILPIPAGYRGLTIGIGRARQFVLDTAAERGQDHIMMMDDDLTGFSILYGTGPGEVSSAYAKIVADRTRFNLGLLTLCAVIAEEAFSVHPELTLIGPQPRSGQRTPEAGNTRWELNSGRIPGHTVSWNVPRFSRYAGEINLDKFNNHGEDLYSVLSTVWGGGSVAKIMAVLTSSFDETRSVIRSPENIFAIYGAEHNALMAEPYRDCVYTRYDDSGRPTWHRPIWRELAKRKPINRRRVTWEEVA